MRCWEYHLQYYPHNPVNSAVSLSRAIRTTKCRHAAPKKSVQRVLYLTGPRKACVLSTRRQKKIAKTYLGFIRNLDFQRKRNFKQNKVKPWTNPYHSSQLPIKQLTSVLPEKPHAKSALHIAIVCSWQTSLVIIPSLDLKKHLIQSRVLG